MISTERQSGHASAYLMLALAAFCWASSAIVAKAVAGEVPPMALNFWRWLIALVLILPWAVPAIRRQMTTVRDNLLLLVVLGGLNAIGFGALYFLGLQFTTAINGALLQATMTLNIVLVAWIFTGVPITGLKGAGILFGFGGVVYIVARGDWQTLVELTVNAGDLIIFSGVILYAFYSVYLAKVPKTLELPAQMALLYVTGAAIGLPLYLIETFVFDLPVTLNWTSVWSIGLVGIFPSLLAQIFWVAAVRRVGPSQASFFIYLAPVFGVLMAIAILGEAFRAFHAVGIVLICVGIGLALIKPKQETTQA